MCWSYFSKQSLLTILALVIVLCVFEVTSHLFPRWETIYLFIAKSTVCIFVTGFLVDLFGGKILKGRINPEGKAVFITGCDSGFGYHLAKRLELKGYKVFAGCLFPTKGGALELKNICSQNLQTLEVDVTKDDSVQKAKNFVMNNLEDTELWAIVNNAGIFKGFDIELSPLNNFTDVLEVNLIGMIRVTKAFLPLLRQSKGRVVNVNSLAGRFNFPHAGPYSVSKHASLSFTECLKQEMRRWGVKVISIEPEFFQTNIGTNEAVQSFLEEVTESLGDDLKQDYGERYLQSSKEKVKQVFKWSYPNIDVVIDALETAISTDPPNTVYKPHRNWIVKLLVYFGEHLPKSISHTFFRALFQL